jgi:peptidoglycan/LPS O-acetylase OafA/YrhL
MPQTVTLSGPTSATRSRLPSLTGLRFVAAATVFFFHAIVYGGLFASPAAQSDLGSIVRLGGWTGVAFFFILSGFVLTWSVRPTDTVQRFWRRRFFKIFPNHLFTGVVAFVLLVWLSSAVLDYRTVFNLLLLQAWFPDLATAYSGNNVSWSLSCELFFYLSFPLLLRPISRIRPERLWAWAGGIAAAILLVPTAAMLVPHGQVLSNPQVFPVIELTEWEQWFVSVFPPVRMLEFVFGMILARIVLTGRRLPLGLGGAVALAIAAYALTPFLPGAYRVAATMAVPLGLVIAAAAASDASGREGWLASRPMVWLGDISFAFYMWHWLVISYGHRLLGETERWSTPVALGVLMLLFAAVLLLAAMQYAWFERPIMRRFATPRSRPRSAGLEAVLSTSSEAPATAAPAAAAPGADPRT